MLNQTGKSATVTQAQGLIHCVCCTETALPAQGSPRRNVADPLQAVARPRGRAPLHPRAHAPAHLRCPYTHPRAPPRGGCSRTAFPSDTVHCALNPIIGPIFFCTQTVHYWIFDGLSRSRVESVPGKKLTDRRPVACSDSGWSVDSDSGHHVCTELSAKVTMLYNWHPASLPRPLRRSLNTRYNRQRKSINRFWPLKIDDLIDSSSISKSGVD